MAVRRLGRGAACGADLEVGPAQAGRFYTPGPAWCERH